MRLMLIAPELNDISQVKSFSGVWSWYLAAEMRRRGIDVCFDAPLHLSSMEPNEIVRHYQKLDLDGVDHILALGTRYFERVPLDCGEVLMRRMKGAVVQLHDAGRPEPTCDCTFTLRSDRVDDRNYYVGWAADHELIKPKQIDGELRILIDHPDYSLDRTADISKRMIAECLLLKNSRVWRGSYNSVRIRRLTDGGIEDICEGSVANPYERKTVPFNEVCEEYCKTSVFVVTHPESVGLSVLETAMAGALVVVPKKFIQPDRLATVRAFRIFEGIPWSDVIEQIDIKASRKKAIKNTWKAVAAKMLLFFKNFKRERA